MLYNNSAYLCKRKLFSFQNPLLVIIITDIDQLD